MDGTDIGTFAIPRAADGRNRSMRTRWPSVLTFAAVLLFGAGYAERIHAAILPDSPSFAGGALLFSADPEAEPLPAPLQSTEAAIRVTGMLARVRVVQQFRNPASAWVEGRYIFPLPDTAAVDRMRLRVGDRLIEGQVRERREAQRVYAAAAASGRRAALVEQERPNMFTTSVANIPPGGTVTVELEYQQAVSYSDGRFSLRFPMVVGPRYIPGQPIVPDGDGASLATTVVADAGRISPPVRHPADGPVNPVRLSVELEPGFPLARVESPYHAVAVGQQDELRYRIGLAEGPVPADRDFVLQWRPLPGAEPRTALFSEPDTAGAGGYGLVQILPPFGDDSPAPPPREMVLVIDVSGSMHGESIAQARAALSLALERLRPGDRFNIIRFNHSAQALFPASRPADERSLSLARRLVAGLEAEGGTEMLAALRLALDQPQNPELLRQVVFITDGAVGDEDRLFDFIRRHAGASRLFTVGIGSAPNSHFMRKAAGFGRGTFTHIGRPGEVSERMGELLRKLESPQLTHLELTTRDGAAPVRVLPERIPDLYRGEPLLLALHWTGAAPVIEVRGRLAGRPWSQTLALGQARAGAGIGVLWARRRIEALMDAHRASRDGTVRDELRRAVVEVALAHHLASPFTSLVAVDVTPVRPGAESLQRRTVATNLPHGWDYDHVFGLPQTATPGPLLRWLGLALVLGTLLGWRLLPGRVRT